MSFESRGTYTECLFHESYRSGDIICHSQGLRVCVCGGGHWRWIILSFVCIWAGVNLNFQTGWMLLYNLPSLHCNFSFYAKKGYLSIKEIHPSYWDVFNSLCVFIRCCCFKSHNSSSQGKETLPKVIGIEGRFNDCIKLISLQTQWVLLDPWTGGFVMIKGLISSNSKEIKLEGPHLLQITFPAQSVCVCLCVCTNYTNHNFD